ncbi:MAG: hypothetical protein L6R36_003853 [Xanthoria steineri]|nr:MAG: hypothetical protein L6R36_003853 [Xanthoria steineri]
MAVAFRSKKFDTSGEAIVHPPGPVTRFLSALHLQGISQVGGCRSDANLRS